MTTVIEEEQPDDFICYLFDSEPKDKNTIQLECPDIPEGKNTHLHIFEQLLMIYVSGLKYLWSDSDGKVDLTGATYNEQTELWELIIDEKDFQVNQDSAESCPVEAIKITKIEENEATNQESTIKKDSTENNTSKEESINLNNNIQNNENKTIEN